MLRPKHTEHSSPVDDLFGGFINNKRFAKLHHAAGKHFSKRTGQEVSPYEVATIALFEDLYNHRFFPGESFGNNSQQPPFLGSQKKCDIVTRYWDAAGKDHTFLFTEGKREANENVKSAEEQLLGYCREHLKATYSHKEKTYGSDLVFGSVIHGNKIGFFLVTSTRLNTLEPLCEYIQVANAEKHYILQGLINVMKDWVRSPEKDEPKLRELLARRRSSSPPGGSRSSPSFGRDLNSRAQGDDGPSGSTPSPRLSARRLPIHSSSPPARRPSADVGHRGYSPSDQSHREPELPSLYPQAAAGSSRQASPLPPSNRSSRSPPERDSASVPARQRDPHIVKVNAARAYEAVAAVERWSDNSFDETRFSVLSTDNAFAGFTVNGADWRKAEIETTDGQKVAGFAVNHASRRSWVYTFDVDPRTLRATSTATRRPTPRWVGRRDWYSR